MDATCNEDAFAERADRMKSAIAKWRVKYRSWADWVRIREIENRQAREAYRAEKAAEGKTVRPYVPSTARSKEGEEVFEFLRRKDSERKKAKYHEQAAAQGRAVREYNDLSMMSDEERADYKRQRDARNKREARKRAKEATYSVAKTGKKPLTFRV